jgi:hypothetical protein
MEATSAPDTIPGKPTLEKKLMIRFKEMGRE